MKPTEEHAEFARTAALVAWAKYPGARTVMSVDDLIASAWIGLLEALKRFDPTRGVEFKSFAFARVNGAIVDAIRACGGLRRGDVKRFRQHGIAVRRVDGAAAANVPSEAPSPEDLVADHQAITMAHRAAEDLLPPAVRDAFVGYYFDGMKLLDLCARDGSSKSWACRRVQAGVDTIGPVLRYGSNR